MMQKTKINVPEEIKKMDAALDKLMEGATSAKLNKNEQAQVIEELEAVIALAEELKADAQKQL